METLGSLSRRRGAPGPGSRPPKSGGLARHLELRAAQLRALALACMMLAQTALAQAASKERVLYNFQRPDGLGPSASLIFDSAGNLYGTTYEGGAYRLYGTAFQLTPGSGGSRSESVLHSFSDSPDAAYPEASLLMDASGNLYGTSLSGGDGQCIGGCGAIFELSYGADGNRSESVIHSFNGTDGWAPTGNLIMDSTGTLYGTTSFGGAHMAGTVFQLAQGPNGTWSETVLYDFQRNGRDGVGPCSGLIFDRAGNLYGTTYNGGPYGKGTVFELKPRSNGKWTEVVLHSFDGHDGAYLLAGLTLDSAGNLYGVCPNHGPHWRGTVFELTHGRDDRWTESILYDFPTFSSGAGPVGDLIWDATGSLYGATARGGDAKPCQGGCGTVFKLSPSGNGAWTETVLYRFNGQDGNLPQAGLIWDATGNLYGTTYYGGTYDSGVAFELTP